jgi:hypothetical protein
MIIVRPDPAGRAGIAELRVVGVESKSGSSALRIRREGWDEGVLGLNGWQGEDALLQPDSVAQVGTELVLMVGWSVCSHLEAGTYVIGVPDLGIEEAVSWPDIRPVRAAPRPRVPAAASPAQVLPRPAEPALPSTDPRPIIHPAAPRLPAVRPASSLPGANVPRPSRPVGLSWVVAVPLLLLIVGACAGGYWYWQLRGAVVASDISPPHQEASVPLSAPGPPSAPPTPPAASPSTPVPSAPTSPALADMKVPDVLGHAHDTAAIAAEGARRLAGQQRDDGMLLLEEAADRGDGSAMAALGALYDPVGFQPGVLARPDPRQAARYYRDAQRAGITTIDAKRNALQEWLRGRAATHDIQADLILRDFWQ